jgi:hypothetical protein
MPSVDFSLKDIKPFAGLLGLGQAPETKGSDVSNMPTPQPVPAQAGFSAFSTDPQRQEQIRNTLTMPGQPIIPPNVPPPTPAFQPMGASMLSASSGDASTFKPLGQGPENPMANIKPLSDNAAALNADRGEQRRLQTSGSGASQIKNPFLRTLAQVGDVAGSVLVPGLNQWIPGTTQHNLLLQRQAGNRVAGDQNALKDEAQLADTQSQTAQRIADANLKGQRGDDLTPFQLSPAQAAAINQPSLAGTQATMRDYNRLLGMAGNNNTSAGNNQRTNDTHVTTTGMHTNSAESIAAEKVAFQKQISDAANKTKTLVASMHDATSRANNANTNNHKAGSSADGGQSFKVPADVTKRGALASNVLENADAVEGIIGRRPDIIGAAGGRYSNVQQMIGSDDKDIQALGVRMHNMALASNGAHGVRAQQAIQKTEDELFGNFKAGPNAIKGALDATRGSMQTFLNDEQNFSTTGKRTGGNTPSAGGSSEKVDGHYDPVTKKVVYH